MTHAERYANSLPEVIDFTDPIYLPRTAHVIAGVFAVVGGFAGFALGTPVGAGVGFFAGAGAGYGAYYVVERFATRGERRREAALEERVLQNFIIRYGDDPRPLSLNELLRMRRNCM